MGRRRRSPCPPCWLVLLACRARWPQLAAAAGQPPEPSLAYAASADHAASSPGLHTPPRLTGHRPCSALLCPAPPGLQASLLGMVTKSFSPVRINAEECGAPAPAALGRRARDGLMHTQAIVVHTRSRHACRMPRLRVRRTRQLLRDHPRLLSPPACLQAQTAPLSTARPQSSAQTAPSGRPMWCTARCVPQRALYCQLVALLAHSPAFTAVLNVLYKGGCVSGGGEGRGTICPAIRYGPPGSCLRGTLCRAPAPPPPLPAALPALSNNLTCCPCSASPVLSGGHPLDPLGIWPGGGSGGDAAGRRRGRQRVTPAAPP